MLFAIKVAAWLGFAMGDFFILSLLKDIIYKCIAEFWVRVCTSFQWNWKTDGENES